MPIYEYRCQECGNETEVLQKLSDEPLVDCPACGKAALKKKVSAAAFRLKGGGWYETDFKTGDKKNLAGGADSASADSGKSDAKAGGGSDTSNSNSGGGSSSGGAVKSSGGSGTGSSGGDSKKSA